jgi:hypothetical protein
MKSVSLTFLAALTIVACRENTGSGSGGGSLGGFGGNGEAAGADGGDAGGGGIPTGDGIEEGGAACSNGVDDDLDGYVDCADRDCALTAGATICPGETSEDGRCSDGVDNDGDGFIDGSDDGCTEDTAELCADGIDNDGNGYTDCADYSCSRNPDLDLDCPSENTDAVCDDGLDNDNNGYVDCDDFGCSRNPDVTICPDELGGGSDGGSGDGGGQAAGGGDGGGGSEDPCGPSHQAGVCADPTQVCEQGQCVARDERFGVPAAPGDLLITEFLANVELANVPDNEKTAEWVEIYNAMDKDVDLRGLLVRDDGTDSFVVGGGEAIVAPAGGYVVLGRSKDRAINGDVDVLYAYDREFTLANGDDEIVLEMGGVMLDSVIYDGDFPHGAGITSALKPESMDHEANDQVSAWCPGAAAWSESSGQKGSPGTENPPCG